MSNIIIRSENLGKRYRIYNRQEGPRYNALRDVITEKFKSSYRYFSQASDSTKGALQRLRGRRNSPPAHEDFWALKDVSFEVNRGDVIGVIGRNGAGKSTLLKILSRITEPTEGRVRIKGRVASLLEVGTGFHPELTGRENIYLNGAVLGMTRVEIQRKFDEIVAFAEIEKFLDTPVKRYSSGMYVRLAFAIAAHLEPEILIVDEVLAVGDAEFQKRCLGKMQDVSTKEGRTVFFVSHNIGTLQGLCTRGVLLKAGQVALDGSIVDVVANYMSQQAPSSEILKVGQHVQMKIDVTPRVVSGEAAHIRIHGEKHSSCTISELCLIIETIMGARAAIIDLRTASNFKHVVGDNEFSFNASIPQLNLVPGLYSLCVYAVTDDFCGVLQNVGQFNILEDAHLGSRYAPEHRGIVHFPVEVNGDLSAYNLHYGFSQESL